jgi:hypothetical protein
MKNGRPKTRYEHTISGCAQRNHCRTYSRSKSVEKFSAQLIAKPRYEFHTELSWFSIDLVAHGC